MTAHMSDTSDRVIERGVALAWTLYSQFFIAQKSYTHFFIEKLNANRAQTKWTRLLKA